MPKTAEGAASLMPVFSMKSTDHAAAPSTSDRLSRDRERLRFMTTIAIRDSIATIPKNPCSDISRENSVWLAALKLRNFSRRLYAKPTPTPKDRMLEKNVNIRLNDLRSVCRLSIFKTFL